MDAGFVETDKPRDHDAVRPYLLVANVAASIDFRVAVFAAVAGRRRRSQPAPRDQPVGDRSAGMRDANGTLWWTGTHLGS